MELEAILSKLKKHTPSILGSSEYSKYAVMVPLIQKEDGIHVLFEVRSLQLRRQPGEICFPGGKIDLDDIDEKAAAIRETKEELGVDSSDISGVLPLDFMVSPFGMLIYPFVGYVSQPEKIKCNPVEVSEVFTVPLSFFMSHEPEIHYVKFKVIPEQNFPYDLIVGGKNYNWRTREVEEYFYVYEDKAIWGMTARILAHFIELLH
ncbi:NUDIX hydrolase [Neobacillus kokaensis]|uniref:Coenzyme A pyrophosphatase n=1 Tax=Neobacillus kokaensis TaxID=2759023 RepID=A0ABQ3N7K4_9BACI|nr:CoA pyrophosphatase [Neobacillus kokaensis]GHI00920.1 coenzyme A pyrophosphatase [Neobacillus kokaensis]